MISLYILCLFLFLVGLYCVVRKRNLIKIIIGIGIMEYAINLLFILMGYRAEGYANGRPSGHMVDPLAQAVVLVAIVIGLALTLLLVTVAIRIYDRYGTFDITKINKLKG